MEEVDVIGLENYDAFYMNTKGSDKEGIDLMVCLSLKQHRNKHNKDVSATGLIQAARVYFSGNLLRSQAMVDVLKTEAIECKHGFPCSASALTIEQTGSFAVASTTAASVTNNRHKPNRVTIGAQPVPITCKVSLEASVFRRALLNFMTGEEYTLVCDAWETRGNGLGFRAVHHEGGCVGLLYLLRDDIMLMEQPLFGESIAKEDAGKVSVGPSPTLFVLDVKVARTFLGLTTDCGIVELAFKECTTTGEQRGTLAYHCNATNGESENIRSVFTASFSLKMA